MQGTPQVICNADSIQLNFDTKNSFNGKVFVKGFSTSDSCTMIGNKEKNYSFTMEHGSCGLRRQREIFITKIDRAFRTSCFYVEAKRSVQHQLDISYVADGLTTEQLEGQTQLPVCKYEILSEPDRKPIKYARIGETVYHHWVCYPEIVDMYCMKVHSCTVYDGQGGPAVSVLDEDGCSTDGVILKDLEYLSDLEASRNSQVFKFADKAGLFFNCQIQLSLKDDTYGCEQAHPRCDQVQTIVEPASKTTEVAAEYLPNDLTSTEAYTVYPPAPPQPQDFITPGYSEVYPSTTTSARYNSPGLHPPESYKKATEQTVAPPPPYRIKRTENQNSTRKVRSVADFDLPETGITVFGIEDHADDLSLPKSSKDSTSTDDILKLNLPCQDQSTVILYLIPFIITLILSLVLSLIIYRQRQIISRTFLKQ
ncbi:hypothetical protein WR25_18614 [Diploscapter pachys]|uniref:ZP domain-containing protein n=1 Tax=Diploscapter pachys TaxID=2018661 RepID=A0A2A2LMV1_9BILA|nr:hypothetical protein WR25_18614 [Diploscapter pachys]